MVNVRDSKSMQRLTKVSVKDSGGMFFFSCLKSASTFDNTIFPPTFDHALLIDIIPLAIKQLSYLTMAFLPPSFAAAFFSMNVTVFNPQGLVTLGEYIALVVPLTLLTVWVVIALEIDIKQVKLHRKNGKNRTEVISSTKRQPKPSQYAIRKANPGKDGDSDESGSDDETLEVRYSYKHQNHVPREGKTETETVWELDSWSRFCWPFILISIALDERRRRQRRKAKAKRRVVIPKPSSSNHRAY